MEAILLGLAVTAPIIALTTAIYLWGRRHSTPDRMRYRILQAALLVVTAAVVAYGVLMFQEAPDDQMGASTIIMRLAPSGVAFLYLARDLRRARNRLNP
jgi:hypothetical protein